MHLALRPGTDGALACGVMHILFRDGLPTATIWPATATCPPSWSAICLAHARMGRGHHRPAGGRDRGFARLYGGTKHAYLRLGYGFTRPRNGAAAMHAASCLPVVTGAWQHPGGGALYNSGELDHSTSR